MKEIKQGGQFKILHEGVWVTVMFIEDYARSHNVSKYKVKQKVQNMELHELIIAGRARMKSLIVIAYDTFKMFDTKIMSAIDGMFKVKNNRHQYDVMFVNQYAEKHGYNSKETLEHQLQKGVIDGLRIQRLNGGYINLIICKK